MTWQLTLTIGAERFAVNLLRPRDISIPLRFDGPQPSVFGAPPARTAPYSANGFIGAVRQGGSCNCDVITLAPHLNGTHTECVGHISSVAVAIHDVLQDTLIPVTLITVAPQAVVDSEETYDPALRPHDTLITRAALEQSFDKSNTDFLEGVVIRTTSNVPAKLARNYDLVRPAFFSIEGIRYLVELGVKHLLTDIPSIDRLNDEGKLTNHHIFWDVAHERHPMSGDKLSMRTITELIYVADDIGDGRYLLNLQIAPFSADASPSRPFLYELTRL